MTKRPLHFIAVLLGGALSAAPSLRPSESVTVSAIVERDDGSFVAGLGQDDFVVTMDGAVRPLDFVKAADEPLTLMLLLDVTMSIQGSQWSVAISYTNEQFARMVDQYLTAALKPPDRLRLGSVAASFIPSARFSSEPEELHLAVRTALNRDVADRLGPSPIWDATDQALALLAAEPGRRAVILFSDGHATGNHRNVADVARDAARLGIAVHVISMAWDIYLQEGKASSALHQRPSLGLRQLADVSGGVFLQASYGSELLRRPTSPLWADRDNQTNAWPANKPGEAFTRVIAGLRTSYLLGFRQDALDGEMHRLEVNVKRPGLTVRAPHSYVGRR